MQELAARDGVLHVGGFAFRVLPFTHFRPHRPADAPQPTLAHQLATALRLERNTHRTSAFELLVTRTGADASGTPLHDSGESTLLRTAPDPLGWRSGLDAPRIATYEQPFGRTRLTVWAWDPGSGLPGATHNLTADEVAAHIDAGARQS
jgi:hypothetical protein